jgi:hypothetical protein
MESQTIPSTADRADSEMVAAAEGTDPTPEVTEDTPARQQPLAGPALNSGPPDYETYTFGYPPFSGRMFGSGR